MAIVAHVCASIGWTWDYCLWQLDIPRLQALNTQWRRFPPPAVQLARIAMFLGLSATKPEAATESAISQDGVDAALDMFPTGPMPVVMSPDEYLRRKAARDLNG